MLLPDSGSGRTTKAARDPGGTVPRGHVKGAQTTSAPIQALPQRRASSKWKDGSLGASSS